MASPRHLWSGEWQTESARAAEELAARRARVEEPLGPGPEARHLVPEASTSASQTRHSVPDAGRPAQATGRPAQATGRPAQATGRPARPSRGAIVAAWLRAVHRQLARANPTSPLKNGAAHLWGVGRQLRARLGRLIAARRRLPVALLIVLATLLSAGVGYAVTSIVTGSGGQATANTNSARPWLGAQLASSGLGSGVIVTRVVPGSPADVAGLRRGDVITVIDNQPAATPSDVAAMIAGMRVGEQVQLEVERGPLTYTTEAKLAKQPAGSP